VKGTGASAAPLFTLASRTLKVGVEAQHVTEMLQLICVSCSAPTPTTMMSQSYSTQEKASGV